jgi:hypothetical protein
VTKLGQHVKALTDSLERGEIVSQPRQGEIKDIGLELAQSTNWELIRADWRNVRDRLELRIDRIKSVNKKAAYNKLDRYSYEKVIEKLGSDAGEISNAVPALKNMNAKFLSLRRRISATSKADVDEFKQWFATVDAVLPKLSETS